MRVLVTGATGFVGSRIVSELLASGTEVVAVGGPRTNASVLADGAKRYAVDVGDAQSVEHLEIIGSVDAVVHTAGLAHRFGAVKESDFRRVNVHGVENVARVAARLGAKHFVLFSSVLVYGREDLPEGDLAAVTEEQECKPADAYGRSKLDGELAARNICEPSRIDLTIFRPSPILGEGAKGNFDRLIKSIHRRRFVMVGHGTNRKSLIYVGDVARATAEVLRQGGRQTQVFNLTNGSAQIKDMIDAITEDLGRSLLPLRIPSGPLTILVNSAARFMLRDRLKRIGATLITWSANDIYSTSKFQRAYGFQPQTTIREAIRRETASYRKQNTRK